MINLVALPCLCVDVFDGTDELRAGGEALNFAVHASKFEEFNVSILGAVGQDSYAKFIMDSVSDKRIDVSHVRVEEDKVTANNRTYLTADGDRYYKDDCMKKIVCTMLCIMLLFGLSACGGDVSEEKTHNVESDSQRCFAEKTHGRNANQ